VHDSTGVFPVHMEDPTRSLKHLPLIKEIDGWHMLHDGYESGSEHDYNEDKFSVLLTTWMQRSRATGRSTPYPSDSEAAAYMTGRACITRPETTSMSTSGFGRRRVAVQRAGWMTRIRSTAGSNADAGAHVVPYRGGFAPDPGTANYADNFIMSDEPPSMANG